MIIAEQMKEIGGLLSNLAEETKLNVNFNTNMENRIIEELSYNNIICSQAIVYNDNKNIPHVNITVREKDANKKSLSNILSRLFKTRLTCGNNNENVYNGTVTIEFVMEPVYDIVYGTKSIIKDDSPISGDTKSIKRIAVDRVLVAISDGMGSGERANKSSINAISMIENFYSAGFDNFSVLSLTNKLLTIGNDETFSALDVCLIDTRSGSADFIKLGSPTSYIKHKEDIETIDNSSLPIGIVEDLYPKTQRKILSSDDLVLWVTDGIYDTLGDNALRRIITETNTTNPQLLCDNIINEVMCNPKIQDDCSCVAIRLFKNT
jgi:stage II sporulation protein E